MSDRNDPDDRGDSDDDQRGRGRSWLRGLFNLGGDRSRGGSPHTSGSEGTPYDESRGAFGSDSTRLTSPDDGTGTSPGTDLPRPGQVPRETDRENDRRDEHSQQHDREPEAESRRTQQSHERSEQHQEGADTRYGGAARQEDRDGSDQFVQEPEYDEQDDRE